MLPSFINEAVYQWFLARYQGFFFDIDGTLGEPIIGKVFRQNAFDFGPWSDRLDLLVALHKDKKCIGLASNQAGVAQGYLSREDIIAHTKWLARYIGVRLPRVEWALAFNYPKAKDPQYRGPDLYVYQGCAYERRKPAPGMLFELLDKFGLAPKQCCYVGDMKIDQEVARAAGIDFYYATQEDMQHSEQDSAPSCQEKCTFFDQLIITN